MAGEAHGYWLAAWLMSTGRDWVALQIGAADVEDFFASGRGLSLSIPESAKPGLYARMRAEMQADTLPSSLVAVAGLVNFVELLCTTGFPAIYTAVLMQQTLSPAAHYAYLGLYVVGYAADDSLVVATAVIALGNRKLTERAGRGLKLLSGAAMPVPAAIMLPRPAWLIWLAARAIAASWETHVRQFRLVRQSTIQNS